MATINLGKVAPVYKGAYNSGTTYNKFEVVFDGESSFISLVDNNIIPLASDEINWIYLCKGSYLATQAIEDSLAGKNLEILSNIISEGTDVRLINTDNVIFEGLNNDDIFRLIITNSVDEPIFSVSDKGISNNTLVYNSMNEGEYIIYNNTITSLNCVIIDYIITNSDLTARRAGNFVAYLLNSTVKFIDNKFDDLGTTTEDVILTAEIVNYNINIKATVTGDQNWSTKFSVRYF